MKKNIITIFALYFLLITKIFANWPNVVCNWLPWCSEDWDPSWIASDNISKKDFFSFIWNMISESIKYVAVIAVISLIISWMMYITSWWEDEKIKKAKKWITWSLVWVIISTSAWAIINLANSFKIT